DLGMRVAQGVDGDPADEVQVLLPVGVPHPGPLPAHEAERGPGIVLKEVLVRPLDERLRVLIHRGLRRRGGRRAGRNRARGRALPASAAGGGPAGAEMPGARATALTGGGPVQVGSPGAAAADE